MACLWERSRCGRNSIGYSTLVGQNLGGVPLSVALSRRGPIVVVHSLSKERRFQLDRKVARQVTLERYETGHT